MSEYGEPFAACSYCWKNGNISYGDSDGRRFEMEYTRTGYDRGHAEVTLDAGGDVEDEGEPEFDDSWEENDEEWDRGEVKCTYCGTEIGYYSPPVTLIENITNETVIEYDNQDDPDYEDDYEDEDEDEEIATPSPHLKSDGRFLSGTVTNVADQIIAATQDVAPVRPDTNEIDIVITT